MRAAGHLKHPQPADFFRTMEDATAEDLDWYWRGWFYGTEPCDIALDTVKWAILDSVKVAQEYGRKDRYATWPSRS